MSHLSKKITPERRKRIRRTIITLVLILLVIQTGRGIGIVFKKSLIRSMHDLIKTKTEENDIKLSNHIQAYVSLYGQDSEFDVIITKLINREFPSSAKGSVDAQKLSDFENKFHLNVTSYASLKNIITNNPDLETSFPVLKQLIFIKWWHVLGFSEQPTAEQAKNERKRIVRLVGSMHPDKHPENSILYTEITQYLNAAHDEFKKIRHVQD